ncbi:hypothetical protein [Allobaculum sp. Allo2]|uniref:hypothetical protein n=1 Tax=Allobaculum sp. Allo2 TaxID=2853432 RepID=UPI001F612CB4|nr:hypothetical protein [Allobaculum sp. Allo2]UNT93090.1 hypothetical protein KWG61_13840 [Allobaculum sp. Allo2]
MNGKTRRENRVMLIGFGIFSELVIDLLLQMIQFEENPVEILIVSEDPEEFERYVKGRPGLRDFFGLIYETPFGTVKNPFPQMLRMEPFVFILCTSISSGIRCSICREDCKRRSAFGFRFHCARTGYQKPQSGCFAERSVCTRERPLRYSLSSAVS